MRKLQRKNLKKLYQLNSLFLNKNEKNFEIPVVIFFKDL